MEKVTTVMKINCCVRWVLPVVLSHVFIDLHIKSWIRNPDLKQQIV